MDTDIPRIGVDESGKGDFYGPLVIAACYVDKSHAPNLLQVVDCKKLSDKKVLEINHTIKETCPHSVICIGPNKYNELYEKFKNLNTLLAWGHARAIENVLEQQECDYVISDQFANPEVLKKQLFNKGKSVRLESRVRAEEDLAVAAASILARAAFLLKLRGLGQEIGTELPKGAAPIVITIGKQLVQKHSPAILKDIAKLHFKTTLQILN